jgi:hypothetical protein
MRQVIIVPPLNLIARLLQLMRILDAHVSQGVKYTRIYPCPWHAFQILKRLHPRTNVLYAGGVPRGK